MDYCYSTDTDDDFLIENTMVGHGWVEGGHLFGSHTSLYLASCWQEALANAAYMAKAVDEYSLANKYIYDANTVKGIINISYWNPYTQWFMQGIMKDGTYHNAEAIMPAVPILIITQEDIIQEASGHFIQDGLHWPNTNTIMQCKVLPTS